MPRIGDRQATLRYLERAIAAQIIAHEIVADLDDDELEIEEMPEFIAYAIPQGQRYLGERTTVPRDQAVSNG